MYITCSPHNRWCTTTVCVVCVVCGWQTALVSPLSKRGEGGLRATRRSPPIHTSRQPRLIWPIDGQYGTRTVQMDYYGTACSRACVRACRQAVSYRIRPGQRRRRGGAWQTKRRDEIAQICRSCHVRCRLCGFLWRWIGESWHAPLRATKLIKYSKFEKGEKERKKRFLTPELPEPRNPSAGLCTAMCIYTLNSTNTPFFPSHPTSHRSFTSPSCSSPQDPRSRALL